MIVVDGLGIFPFLALANGGRTPVGSEFVPAVRELARLSGMPFPARPTAGNAPAPAGASRNTDGAEATSEEAMLDGNPHAGAGGSPMPAQAEPQNAGPLEEAPPGPPDTMYDYPWHPLAELLPLLESAELARLADDIRENGLRDPITLLEGKVLDGRNRLRACELALVEPRFEQYGGADPLGFVLSKNLHRRHLRESQRAMLAARAKSLFEDTLDVAGAKRANLPAEGRARDAAARLLNVSPRSVENASMVLREGAPELVHAVESGELAVSRAVEVARVGAEDRERAEAAEKAAVEARTREEVAEAEWQAHLATEARARALERQKQELAKVLASRRAGTRRVPATALERLQRAWHDYLSAWNAATAEERLRFVELGGRAPAEDHPEETGAGGPEAA